MYFSIKLLSGTDFSYVKYGIVLGFKTNLRLTTYCKHVPYLSGKHLKLKKLACK